jgi:hypothetical protein
MKLPGYIKELTRMQGGTYLISFQLTPDDFSALIERINGRFNDERLVLVSGPEEIGDIHAYVYWSKTLTKAPPG